MFAPSFWDHLEDRLNLAVFDTNAELRQRRLNALLDELKPMKFRITEPVFFFGKQREVGEIMEAPVGPYRETISPGGFKRVPQFIELPQELPEQRRTVNNPVISRIKAKAMQARGIAPKAIADFEKDLDGLIAEGPKLDAERANAVGMHHEAFAGVRGEFDGLREAMGILSNGGPALDPLPESASAAPESNKPV